MTSSCGLGMRSRALSAVVTSVRGIGGIPGIGGGGMVPTWPKPGWATRAETSDIDICVAFTEPSFSLLFTYALFVRAFGRLNRES